MTTLQDHTVVPKTDVVRAVRTAPIQTEMAPALPERRSLAGNLWQGLRRLGAFLVWLLTGFGLLGLLFKKSKPRHGAMEEIVLYTVSRSFFLWAIILVGFIGAACVRQWPHAAPIWGWVYIWVLLYTLVTLMFDISTPRFLLWFGGFAFVWILSKYFEDVRGLYLLSGVMAHLRELRPELNSGFATVISWLLLLPWLGGLFHSFSYGRKTFSPNSIEEWYLGEGREILDRSGLKFRSRYRDLFECILGLGAGDLEAIDANHHVVKKWESILFLFFHWNRLDQILHQRAATVDTAQGDALEVQAVHR